MNALDADIYEKHRDDLVRYATALVGPDEAADVVSTVVVRVLAKRSLADLREARPYLFRAVLNEARTHLRRRKPTWRLPNEAEGPAPEIGDDVIQAVLDLPGRQRAATYLVYWEGMTVTEAAEMMGAQPGTVKRYLHLARQHLRKALDEHRDR